MALPKKNRLKGKHEFSRVHSGTRPVVSEHFSLRSTRDTTGSGQRFAVVVPAKIVVLASARNLLRRKTAEALSRIIREFPVPPGIRAVISVRKTQVPPRDALERELMSLMKKSGILNT